MGVTKLIFIIRHHIAIFENSYLQSDAVDSPAAKKQTSINSSYEIKHQVKTLKVILNSHDSIQEYTF